MAGNKQLLETEVVICSAACNLAIRALDRTRRLVLCRKEQEDALFHLERAELSLKSALQQVKEALYGCVLASGAEKGWECMPNKE